MHTRMRDGTMFITLMTNLISGTVCTYMYMYIHTYSVTMINFLFTKTCDMHNTCYICMYVCMYVCMYMRTCMYVYTYIHMSSKYIYVSTHYVYFKCLE